MQFQPGLAVASSQEAADADQRHLRALMKRLGLLRGKALEGAGGALALVAGTVVIGQAPGKHHDREPDRQTLQMNQ